QGPGVSLLLHCCCFYLNFVSPTASKRCSITEDGCREKSTLISPNDTENRPCTTAGRVGPVGPVVHLAHASFLHAYSVAALSVGVAHCTCSSLRRLCTKQLGVTLARSVSDPCQTQLSFDQTCPACRMYTL
ncbi:unnamed protein product, partial [Ectocarpus sp. 8 AP-2014]